MQSVAGRKIRAGGKERLGYPERDREGCVRKRKAGSGLLGIEKVKVESGRNRARLSGEHASVGVMVPSVAESASQARDAGIDTAHLFIIGIVKLHNLGISKCT